METIEIHPKGGDMKWIINTDKYCGKFYIKGKKCSWHYHKKKMKHSMYRRWIFKIWKRWYRKKKNYLKGEINFVCRGLTSDDWYNDTDYLNFLHNILKWLPNYKRTKLYLLVGGKEDFLLLLAENLNH